MPDESVGPRSVDDIQDEVESVVRARFGDALGTTRFLDWFFDR